MWSVFVIDEAQAELETLPADIKARFIRVSELLADFGPHAVREPYVKHLSGKLWEMRMKGRDGIARAIYFSASGRRLVVVHAFTKKTQRTPRRAIELAERRMELWNG
jgi:phage-related protein